MKRIILLNALLIASFTLLAQLKSDRVEIQWSEEFKESRRSTLSGIVGEDHTGFYALKVDAKGGYKLILEHFNNNLQKIGSNEIEVNQDDKKRIYEGIVQLNNDLFIFTSIKDNKKKQNILSIQGIDKQNLTLKNNRKQIAIIDYEGSKKKNAGNFSYQVSMDGSKVLVYYNLPFEKNQNERFGFHVLDNELNQLWEKIAVLPYEEGKFGIVDYRVSADGDVYLLGRLYDRVEGKKKNDKANVKHLIFGYTNKGETVTEYVADGGDYYLSEMSITVNDDKDIICAGFYSNAGTIGIRGSYFLKIDGKTKQIKTKNFKEFGLDFITQNMSDRMEKKAKKNEAKGKEAELYRYDLNDLILKDDGGVMLVGEQFYIETRVYTTTVNGRTTTRTVYYYYYNDIIIINISPNGDIEWAEKIPKHQVSSNDGGFFSSYALSLVGDKLYFVFNDHPENLVYEENKKVRAMSLKNGVAALVTVDSDGRHVREALFSSSEADVFIRPKVSIQMDNNELILFGQKGKAQKYAKVKFK